MRSLANPRDVTSRPPTPYRPLLWAAAAVGLGVTVDRGLAMTPAPSLLAWWWSAGALLLAAAVIRSRRRAGDLSAALLLAAAAAVGATWHDWRWTLTEADELGRFAREAPQPACLRVVLADRVRVSPPAESSPLRAIPARTMSEATVRVAAIRDGRTWRPAGGWSRLRVAGELAGVAPGDRLEVFGQLGRTPAALNPGQYDWAAAERRDGRFTEVFCDAPQCVAVEREAPLTSLSRALYAVRSWCSGQLAANVPTRDAPLVLATLLGDQERLGDSTKDAFLKTGSIHLLVISGAHLAMLAVIVWQVAWTFGLSTRMHLTVVLATVLVYSAIVGLEPSVTRAMVLTVATILALVAGRRASAANVFGAAALVVMVLNPDEAFRSGTQFSFLAVAVLILFAQWPPVPFHLVRRHIGAAPIPIDPLVRLVVTSWPWHKRATHAFFFAFRELTLASIAVGIVMAPLVAYHFHVVTPAAIILTPLASPLIAVALAAGLGVLTVGWLLPPLGGLLGAVCGWSLHATEILVQWAAEVPGSYWYANGPAVWWLCVFYGSIALVAVIPELRPHWRWQAAAAMVWAAVGYASIGAGRMSPEELRCTFLAVGHGTCAVLELPSGETILYDAGSLGSPEMAHQTIASFLWSRGIDRIDALVLSHADIDHYNATPGLLERFPVGAVYISPMMFDPVATGGRLAAPNYLRDVLAASGVPLRQVWMNDRLRTSGAETGIEVLHPPREGVFGRDNANSLLLAVEFGGRRILLPGDLESPGIERVMADPPLDCDVLLAPHHGSENSDPPGFAAWCRPEWVVMSGRRPERTLLSAVSYQEAGAQVFHTALSGAVSCLVSEQGVRTATYQESPGD